MVSPRRITRTNAQFILQMSVAASLICSLCVIALAQAPVLPIRIARPNGLVSPFLSEPPNNGIDYHGGPIMPFPHHVYFVWYGNWAGNTATSILPDLISGLRGSAYFNINSSYNDDSGQSVATVVAMNTQTFDNYSQGLSLTDQSLKTVITQKLQSGALPTDQNGIYFVLTSADVDENGSVGHFCVDHCGFHTRATLNGADIKYAFVGNGERCIGTCTSPLLGPGPNSNIGADGMASVVAHELEETVTDPHLNAWYDENGNENADKCAWQFDPYFSTPNGSVANMTLSGRNFLIQKNWYNTTGGHCRLKLVFEGGPASQHVFEIDTLGHIRELVWSSPTSWTNNDQTDFAAAPAPASGSKLTGYLGPGTTLHVFYLGSNQHVYTLFYDGVAWSNSDMMSLTGLGTLAASGSALTSYINTAGQHVFFIGTNQHVYTFFHNGTSWSSNDVTALTGAPNAASGTALASYIDGAGQHVFFLGANQHVYTLYHDGTSWSSNDVSALSGAPLAAVGSQLVGYYDSIGQHVFFMGTNQHVYAFYHNVGSGSWSSSDVTAAAGAPIATAGSAITGYSDSLGQHVFFIGTNQHVYAFYRNPDVGVWSVNDVSSIPGAPLAVSGSSLTGYSDSTGQHVFYLGTNQHTNVLYKNPSNPWTTNDVTSLANAPNAAPNAAIASPLAGFPWP